MKKKGRKAFWRNFKFKYKLTVINENTLEEVVGIHVSKLNGLSVLLSACAVIFLIAAVIIIFTPLRNYLPGYMDSHARALIVENSLRADSLQKVLERQDQYVANIKNILSGEIRPDTIQSIDSLTQMRTDDLLSASKEEEEFRKRYEAEEQYNLTAVSEESNMTGLVFHRPVRGIVAKPFAPSENRFGVEITANPHESILADLDGTIVFAAYTAEWEYVIQVQHEQNFVSTYRMCGSLIRHEGDKVKGGEAIALVGKSNVENEKPHLHYELWYKGTPINPEKYIAF